MKGVLAPDHWSRAGEITAKLRVFGRDPDRDFTQFSLPLNHDADARVPALVFVKATLK